MEGITYTSQLIPLAGGVPNNPGAILLNEIIFDLLLTPAFDQFLADQLTPLGAGCRWADIQGDVFAHRAVELFGNRIYLVIGGGRLLSSYHADQLKSKKKGK